MNDPALMVMAAFVEALSELGGYAVLRRRGREPGYAHVVPPGFDPSKAQNRHVSIELFNGTVAVTEKLHEALSAHLRPNTRINEDALGYSAGPNYGRFEWALTHDEVIGRWGNELAFAREVGEMLLTLPTQGDTTLEGDYG